MKGIIDKIMKNKILLFIAVLELVTVLLFGWLHLIPQKAVTVDLGRLAENNANFDIIDGQLVGDEQTAQPTVTGDNYCKTDFTIITLKPGKYIVETVYSEQNVGNGLMNGVVEMYVDNERVTINENNMYLFVGENTARQQEWIISSQKEVNLGVGVKYYIDGTLKVESIVFKEAYFYSFFRFLVVLLVIALINFLIYVFTCCSIERKIGVAAVISGTVFSSVLLSIGGVTFGHDVLFHMNRISEIADGIKAGNFNIHIQQNALNGYGYATPLFYGQLLLYIPALLYLAGIPFYESYNIFVLLVNFATAALSYYSFKKIFKSVKAGAAGSLIYTISIYRITDIYVRQAVGEYTALIFLPLVAYGVYELYFNSGDGKIRTAKVLPLVLGVTGILQCHVITTQITAVCLVVFGLIMFKKTFSRSMIMALIRALVLIVLVNLAFLVPFLDSYRMDLNVKNQDGTIQYMGARFFQVFGLFFTMSGDSKIGVDGEMPICIGMSALFGMLYYLYYTAKYKPADGGIKYKKAGDIMFALAAMTILFSTVYFPWDAIESLLGAVGRQLVVIQFPWRYLSIASLFVAVLMVCMLMLHGDEHRKQGMIVFGIFMAMNIVGLAMFYKDYANDGIALTYCDTDEFGGNIGQKEYMLIGSEDDMCEDTTPHGDADTSVSDYVRGGKYISFYCENRGDAVEFVNIPLWAYDNYKAYDMQTGEHMLTYKTDGNRLTVGLVPGYSGYVMVKYVEPWYWKVSYIFAASGVLLIIAICVVDKKRKKAD